MTAAITTYTIRPFWAYVVALVVAAGALVTAGLVVTRASNVLTLRVDAAEEDTSQRVSLSDGRAVETAMLHGRYGHATFDDRSCTVVVRDLPPGDEAAERNLAALYGVAPPPPSVELTVPERTCDEELRSALRELTVRLDAWLVAGGRTAFDETAGTFSRGAPAALGVLLASALLCLAMLRARRELSLRPTPAGIPSAELVTRFGRQRKVVAALLASEIRRVQLTATKVGPLTFHRLVLVLASGRVLPLWRLARPGLERAIAARDAVTQFLESAQRGGRAAYRG